MRTVSISVTDASRNFADCVNRARYQGTTFVLHKNGVAVARIAPVERNTKPTKELDDSPAEDKQPQESEQELRIARAPDIW